MRHAPQPSPIGNTPCATDTDHHFNNSTYHFRAPSRRVLRAVNQVVHLALPQIQMAEIVAGVEGVESPKRRGQGENLIFPGIYSLNWIMAERTEKSKMIQWIHSLQFINNHGN